MAITDRMLTEAEMQALIDRRAAVRNIAAGPASGWTSAETNNVRQLLVRLTDLAIDGVGITAEQHQTKMANDPRYRHFWRMGNDHLYNAAWSYAYDQRFRATADGDAVVYADVIAGMKKFYGLLEGDPAIVAEALGEISPPDPTPQGPPFVTQARFRGRNDDGTLITPAFGGASWKAATNENWSQAPGTNFRLRIEAINSSPNAYAGGMQLWCQKNADAWRPVTATSGVARSSPSPAVADSPNWDPGRQIAVSPPDPNGYSVGGFDEADGFTPISAFDTNTIAEYEYCLQLVAADLAAGDAVSFRLCRGLAPGAGTLLDAYPQMPVVTVV